MSYETRLIVGRLNYADRTNGMTYMVRIADFYLSTASVFENTYVDETDKGPRAWFIDGEENENFKDKYGADLYGNPPFNVLQLLAKQKGHPIARAALLFIESLYKASKDDDTLAVIIYGY